MEKPDLAELIRTFELLGVDDPRGWARSQIEGGVNQDARAVFLRHLSNYMIARNDARSIKHAADEYGEELKAAWRKLSEMGLSREAALIARMMQCELFRHVCAALDSVEGDRFGMDSELEQRTAHVQWCLHQINDEGAVLGVIDGLHESVDEFARP